jgi:hypothetical protein
MNGTFRIYSLWLALHPEEMPEALADCPLVARGTPYDLPCVSYDLDEDLTESA